MGDPRNVINAFWPAHLQTLLHLVPHLKIEWLSCMGPDFEETKAFSGSLGLRSAFEHVVIKPPPTWSMSASTYRRLHKWLRF